MITHLLWQADVADFDAWHGVFKDDVAARKAIGVRALHVWRDPDNDDRAIVLFEVLDMDKANAFFESEELAMHMERDGIAHVDLKRLIPA